MKIIHCADLHLSSGNREYSLGVLKEIVDIANGQKADYLLFAGDIFDSFDEIEKLSSEFKGILGTLDEACEAFLLVGNHEDLGRNKKSISSTNFGLAKENVITFEDAPFRLIERKGLEILAIPHQKDYRGYIDWPVPTKNTGFRIALAHASNEDLSFAGLFDDEEEKAGVMDSDLFQRFKVDYAALGHIHLANNKTMGQVLMAYPGSARVWRKDEFGPRSLNLLECSDSIRLKKIELKSAGQFRSYHIDLGLDGKPSSEIAEQAKDWGKNDCVQIELNGLVEDISVADMFEKKILHDYKMKLRKLKIIKDNLETCSGIASQEIAKKFLNIWESKKPAMLGDELEVWQKAREIGLRKIKEVMEAKR